MAWGRSLARGVACTGSGAPAFTDCTISENYSSTSETNAAGLYCSAGSPTFLRCIISGNSATNLGGGVYCAASGASFTDCVLAGNFARYGGSGFYISASPTITGCTISGNTGSWGSGFYINGGSPSIVNCLITGNSASYGTGFSCFGGTPSITNCTIANNSASSGGGVYCGSTGRPTLTNCILEGNSGYAIYEAATAADATVTNCLFWNNPEGDYRDENVASYTGANDINMFVDGAMNNKDGDPLFVSASTGDYHLQNGSAALDRATSGRLASDFEGDARPRQRRLVRYRCRRGRPHVSASGRYHPTRVGGVRHARAVADGKLPSDRARLRCRDGCAVRCSFSTGKTAGPGPSMAAT